MWAARWLLVASGGGWQQAANLYSAADDAAWVIGSQPQTALTAALHWRVKHTAGRQRCRGDCYGLLRASFGKLAYKSPLCT